MNKRFIITVVTLLIIGLGTGLAMMLAKGYTFSPKDGKLLGTGIIAVTSVPEGASVYIDGHLTTATNTTISQLSPKKYDIRIVKDGFISWEKSIEVKAGLVSEVKATLFPALPTIYPLTLNGVTTPLLSPDGQKLAFAVPSQELSHGRQKGGVWVWTMTSQPLSLSRDAEPHQILASTNTMDFSKAKLTWSTDSKSLLVTLQESDNPSSASTRNFLLPYDRETSLGDLRDITPMIDSTLKEWQEATSIQDMARLAVVNDPALRQIASSAAALKWSPDETKFMVGVKVYDLGSLNQGGKLKQQGGFKSYDLSQASAYLWLPDSRHIILIQEDKISISDFDGSNMAVIYAGKFEDTSVFPWPDSSRLVVMTSFNTPTANQPNLFGINLK
ncbi:MAG: PEGA domain-containing protein [bacterium]|nr:PEGA domain-containing protein [bacterium]